MEKRTFTNILITLGILLLIPIGVWLFVYLQNQNIDWTETYKTKNEEPYNNYMVFNLLKGYKTDKEFVVIDNLLTEKLAEEEIKNSKNPISYIFIGNIPILLDEETDSLLHFVEKGNTAFIIANRFPDTLFMLLDLSYKGYDYVYDSLISTNFTNSTLQNSTNFKFNYRQKNESVATSWNYYNYPVSDKEIKEEKLGFFYEEADIIEAETSQQANKKTITKYTNFIRIKHGKGYFYFHRNPILFTNYYAIQEDGKKYIERTFSYLPEGNILWDERSHFGKQGKREYQKGSKSPSPLSYILSQPSLAWAYYILLISAILFVIFRGKRMQRIIPILRKEENTSLEFTKTIGQLYYLQKDHKRLSQLKIRLFFDFIRTKYYLNTQNIDEDFRKKLSERSGLNREFIDSILSDIQKVNGANEVSEWLLRKIHTQIQEFYTNCK